MSLQIRPGYRNPLTMLKENKINPLTKQTWNTQDERSDKLTELRTKQQSLQNEILIMQSTGTDSAAVTSEKVEALQKQLESVSSELRAAQNSGGSDGNSALLDIDTYEGTETKSESPFIKLTSTDQDSAEENPAVKISISSEGKQSYRDSLIGKSESFDSVLAHKEKLLSQKEPFIISYEFELKLIGGKHTTEEIASDLFQTYAEKYDEIVKGYQSGQRVSYAADPKSEIGYHQMTMTEELNALNDAYQAQVDRLERRVQQIPENINIFHQNSDVH